MIIREVIRPGLYVYKVFSADGALMYYGSSEKIAETVEKELENVTSSDDGE